MYHSKSKRSARKLEHGKDAQHLSSSTQIPNFHDVSEHIEVDYSLNMTILHSQSPMCLDTTALSLTDVILLTANVYAAF